MEKCKTYEIVRDLIKMGRLTNLHEIFQIIPKNTLCKDLRITIWRYTKLFNNPKMFTIEELERLSGLIGVEVKKILLQCNITEEGVH